MTAPVSLGKPASYGDFVLGRRVELIDAMGEFRGGRLLDVGCGNGAQTVRFLDRFDAVVGLDVVPQHLAEFQCVLDGMPAPNCRTVHYDGGRMPFEDASFDAVLSIETLEHVDDEAETLREIHRVLRPGGALVLSVPNKWWIFETHGARLPLLPWNRVPFFSWLPRSIHSRFAKARIYTRRDITTLVGAHGFEVRAARYLTAPMDAIGSETLAHFLRGAIFRGHSTRWPVLSTSIFVRAQPR